MTNPIGIEKCKCGSPVCSTYWLTGVGVFVQGSGFTIEEAEKIAHALNKPDTMSLDELMSTQAKLQARMGEPTGTGEAGLKESLLHVIVETVEAMREINFKPWKANQIEVNKHNLSTEMMDILQFWANGALAMGLTPQDLTSALRKKWGVNHQRIDDGDVVEAK